MIVLLSLGVAIIAYVAMIIAFPKVLPEEKDDHIQNALERIYMETRGGEIAADRDVKLALKSQLADEVPWVRTFYNTSFTRPMYEGLVQAGYMEQALSISLYCCGGAVLFVMLFFGLGIGLLSLPLGIILAYYIAYKHCMSRVAKRNKAFLAQFPDVIDMIVRSVRAGFPLNTALHMIADNMEEPSKSEFRYVLNDIELGRSVNLSLTRLASRVSEQDVKFFTVMIAIQQETGGNLAEVLANLSGMLRKRRLLRDKLRALTSEGRATGWILSSLPILVFFALYFIQPNYLVPLWTVPLGIAILGVAIFLVILCNFIVRQMINIDI